MAALKILEDGHPALKTACKRVGRVTDEIRKLAEDMAETMFEYAGVGLAANQVGGNVRMIVVYDENEGHKVYINPRIVKHSREVEYSDEGCLSFPRMFGTVGRAMDVIVTAQDLDMKKVKVEVSGFLARVFQHETDHLNGITFVERAEEGTVRRLPTEEEIAEKEKEEAAAAAAAGEAGNDGIEKTAHGSPESQEHTPTTETT